MHADMAVFAPARVQFYQPFDLVQFGKFIASVWNVDRQSGTDQSSPMADAHSLYLRCSSYLARWNNLAGHETKHDLG